MNVLPIFLLPAITATMMILSGFSALEDRKTEVSGRILICLPVVAIVAFAIFDYFSGTELRPYFMTAKLRELVQTASFLMLGVALLALFQARYQVRYSVFFWGTTILCIATTFHLHDFI